MTDTQQVVRLSPEMYEHLEKQLPAPQVNRLTTELEAGFNLGVQHVLKLLRTGFVAGQ
jgi:hypothetical protein